jgi:hypothetical protein
MIYSSNIQLLLRLRILQYQQDYQEQLKLSIALSHSPALIGIAALVVLYYGYREWKKEKDVVVSSKLLYGLELSGADSTTTSFSFFHSRYP